MGRIHKKFDFQSRLLSMLKVDFRRLFTIPLYYILLGISFLIPILIFVMTSMMEGQVQVDPTTGNEITIETFSNVWQSLGAIQSDESGMTMDLISMCNVNLMFFVIAVLVCLFISDDFKSGYSKHLFTIRANKLDYVISKSFVLFISGVTLLLAYFIGALVGGKIAGLSFALEGIHFYNILMCLFSKIFFVLIFVSIFVMMSVLGKNRTWLSLLGSLAMSMLLYTMVPMITPLDSTIANVLITLIGGLLFSIVFGIFANLILKKTNLV